MALIEERRGGRLGLPGSIDRRERRRDAAAFRAGPMAIAVGLSCALGACSANQRGSTAQTEFAARETAAQVVAGPVAAPAARGVQTAMAAPAPTPRLVSSSAVADLAQPPRVTLAAAPKTLAPPRVGKSGSGLASWYGGRFHGQKTANGERFDMRGFTAAHRSFPLPSYVRVTNASNGRSIVVRVNDRGPFHDERVIDVSQRTADVLGFSGLGVGNVKLDYIAPAPKTAGADQRLLASYQEFGRPSAPAGMQVAGLTPVSDADLAAGTSTVGAAYAVASVAVATSAAALSSSASAVAAGARAAVRSVATGASPDTQTVPPPSATAYAPPQPLLASVPEAIAAPKRKRIAVPSEPALASATPVLLSPSAALAPASVAGQGPDAAARVAASFESFGAVSVRAGGSVTADAIR